MRRSTTPPSWASIRVWSTTNWRGISTKSFPSTWSNTTTWSLKAATIPSSITRQARTITFITSSRWCVKTGYFSLSPRASTIFCEIDGLGHAFLLEKDKNLRQVLETIADCELKVIDKKKKQNNLKEVKLRMQEQEALMKAAYSKS